LPSRLSDVVNVLDWGAAPGASASANTNAIQKAIDYCINTKGGGKIFVPTGIYNVNPLSVGTNDANKAGIGVQIIGCGQAQTNLVSAVPGWTLSQGVYAYDCLERVENIQVAGVFVPPIPPAGQNGAIRLTRPGAICHGVHALGWYGIDVAACTGALLIGCGGAGPTNSANTDASDLPYHGNNAYGSVGFQIGDACVVKGGRNNGYDIACAISGSGASLHGCAFEVNNIGIRVGWRDGVETPAYGVSILGVANERNDIGVELYNCQGGFIAHLSLYVGQGTSNPAVIDDAVYNSGSGLVTVTTHKPHNLLQTDYVISIGALVGNPAPGFNRTFTPQGWVKAHVTGTNTFTYPCSPAPTGAWGTGGWQYAGTYAMRLRKVYETLILGTSRTDSYTKASFDLDYADVPGGGDPNVEFRNVVFDGIFGQFGWNLPSSRKQLAGLRFLNCGGEAASVNLFSNNVATPNGNMVFANLPGQSGPIAQPGPLIGQTYDIIDGATTSIGSAVSGGGGSGSYLVRWNGSAWIRMG